MADEVQAGGEQQQQTTPSGEAQQQQQQAPSSGPKMLTNDEVNALIAKERRKMKGELTTAKQQAEAYQRLQGQVAEVLNSGLIDGVEDLSEFREAATQTIEQYRSDAEKREIEQNKLTKDLEAATNRATDFQARYEQAQVNRSIADEAGTKALDEGALELIQMKLAPLSEVQEDGSVLVSWGIKDEDTGKVVTRRVPVKEAVELMEAHPTKYRGLFKATQNGGTGGEQIDGVRRTSEGEVDLANMSFEKYLEVQRKNPGLIATALEKQRGTLG